MVVPSSPHLPEQQLQCPRSYARVLGWALHAVGFPSPSLTISEDADAVPLEAGQHSRLQLPEDLGTEHRWEKCPQSFPYFPI